MFEVKKCALIEMTRTGPRNQKRPFFRGCDGAFLGVIIHDSSPLPNYPNLLLVLHGLDERSFQ